MARVHWLGAGLSSVPGIRRLAASGVDMVLWNRTLSRAEAALTGFETHAQASALNWEALEYEVAPGDVVVSMLPGTLHLRVAELCLGKKAHFICSSYILPEIQALHGQAKQSALCFVNEVGLDPGIDHLLAHSLVEDYKNSPTFNPAHKHFFRSYCGGFPKQASDFTYKFSWSPLGVLKALKSEACWIEEGEERRIATPWKAVGNYTATVADGGKETFEAYPNRNSLPFMNDYKFGVDWNTQQFVRGTLRLNGWSIAWKSLFDEIENLRGEAGDARLAELSELLWKKYAYEPGEQDRVVLCVELEVRDAESNAVVWHQSFDIDEAGKQSGSAMGRLVSVTVSLAVESVLKGELPTGVSAAPKDPQIVERWLDNLRLAGEVIPRFDHLGKG